MYRVDSASNYKKIIYHFSLERSLQTIPSSPAPLHLLAMRHALRDVRGQRPWSYISSPLDVALQVTVAIQMIVSDIRLVFSDLH